MFQQLQFVGFTLASAAAALPGLPVRVRVPGGPVLDAARTPGAALAAAHAALAAALLAAPSALWAPPPQEEPPLAVVVASMRDEESEDKARLGHREDDDVYPRDDSGASPSAPSRASGGLRAPLLPESAASAASARRRVLLVAVALSAANGGTRLALAILETVGPSVFYALWADAHPLATDAVFLVHQTASPLDAFLLLVGRAKLPASASPAAVHAGALFWGGVGGLGLVAFAFMYVASRRGASYRALLAIGAALCAAGCALAASADAAAGGPASRLLRFQAGVCLAWGVGFPLAQAAAVAALAKAVPPARLGAAMAAQAMAGSLGRVVGPLLAGSLYDGRGGARALVAAGAAAAAAAALVAAMWRMLRPR